MTPSSDTIDPSTHIGLETETLVVFGILAAFALALDIWVHRKDTPIPLKSAVAWTLFWITISMCFAGFLYYHFNAKVASLFLAGYLFEQALSVDNLFVMMAIFAWFKIPEQLCHRVLYWGVLGAIVFRLLFVVIGSSLFALGPFVELIFAAMVAASGFMMLRKKEDDADEKADYSNHIAFRAVRIFFPVFPKLVGHNFFIKHDQAMAEMSKPENKDLMLKRTGAVFATPLFLCLAVIETTDVMFAFDSVPAVIAVSREPLIVYSAMIFAVMGLRSMYFVLDAMRQYLIHLEKAVTILLFFIAFKLGASACLHLTGFGVDIDVYTSLMVIAVILALGIIASFIFPAKKKEEIQITSSTYTGPVDPNSAEGKHINAAIENEANKDFANATSQENSKKFGAAKEEMNEMIKNANQGIPPSDSSAMYVKEEVSYTTTTNGKAEYTKSHESKSN